MRKLVLIAALIPSIHFAQVWEQLPSFPGTPRDDAASFTIDDHIYVGTGMEVGWGLTNDWYRFDMINETWEPIASMPASPRQYCTTFTIQDTGYVFGGLDADGALNELWAYSNATGWVQKASLPAEARYACVGAGFFHGMIATGMLASGEPTNEAWRYLPGTDAWEPMAEFPGTARHRAASIFDQGGITICGGADADFNALDDCWNYPLAFEVGQWYDAGTMPAPRYGHRGAETMVLIGGASDTFVMHDDVWNMSSIGPPDLPAFEGGPRRGGIIYGNSSLAPITISVYFGLGIGPLDGDFVRHNDWWKLSFPVSVDEHSARTFSLFPNPASDRITLQLSDQWNNGTVFVHDALDRAVKQIALPTDRVIDISDLAPGRYEIFVTSSDQRTLRAPLIKLE